MRDCTYGNQIDEETVECENTLDLIHGGTVPLEICNACPYAQAVAKDYFTANARLLIKKQAIGEYNPKPKSCSGCVEVKRRDADLELPMQFIWPYWHGGASGDEIRFSVRSVEKFFQGKAKCLIIGDRPPWYSGPHLKKNRIGNDKNHRRFRDTLSKLYWMATRPEVDSEFIWMMDDIYFLKPFSVEDVQQPRAETWGPSEFNSWQRRKTNTMASLAERERTTHDYATHMPHHVEKAKLAELFEEFNLHENTLLWEVLYGNTYREQPIGIKPFFRRFQTPRNLQTLRNLTKKATIMNHTSGAWSPEMREFLMERLPDMATCEAVEGLAVPTFKKQRVVKRRPATVTTQQELQPQ